MPRKTPCAYCCKQPGPTNDHVIAQMFFIEQPVNHFSVPCCQECQTARAADDEVLRQIFMMEWNTCEHPVAAKLFDTKITRAILNNNTPFLARVHLDNHHVPVRDNKNNIRLLPAMKVDPELLDRAFRRITQGLHRWVYKENWCPEKHLEVRWLTLDQLTKFNNELRGINPHKQEVLGDGVFEYRTWRTTEDEPNFMWICDFYRGIYFHATTFDSSKAKPFT